MKKKLLSLKLMVFIIIPISDAIAQTTEDADKKIVNSIIPYIPPINSDAVTDSTNADGNLAQLFLSVSINSGNTHDLLSVKQDQQQQLFVMAKDLRAIRIKLDPSIADQQWVRLSSISGLNYHYQDTTQHLDLQLPLELLQKYDLNLQNPRSDDQQLSKIKPLSAAILNYQLYNTNTDGDNVFSATTELRLNSKYGYLSSGFLYNNDHNTSYKHQDFVRLNTNWQYLDPIKIRILTIGDFISNTANWGNSVRLAGIQWSSAYSQRSDIVTAALPQFTGSAALPSTLDLFVNQQRVYSGSVPSGEFDIKALPYVSGNEVTLITTDATGQQHIEKQAYYYSAKILAEQIKEFSIDLGVPRFHFGTESSNYDDDVIFGSGSLRYGWNNNLTLSSALEASSDGLFNAGVGFAKRLFGRGIINANLAGSHYDDQSGYLGLIGIEGRLSSKLAFNLSQQRSFDNYYDLARVSRVRYVQQYGSLEDEELADYSPFANQISRFGFNYNIAPGVNTNLSYSRVTQLDSKTEYLSLNFGTRLGKKWSLYATGLHDLQQDENNSVYLVLRYTPSHRLHLSSSINHSQDSNSYRQEITGLADPKLGSIGWGASYESNDGDHDRDFASVYATYKSRPAFLSARYNHYQDSSQTVLSAKGALLYATGNAFVANEIGDGFAVISNAGPKSQIINGGVNLGKTDRKGQFLIPRLAPYKVNHIYLDPTDLPLDWLVEHTEQTAITAYRQGTLIDFGARRTLSATLQLVDQHHQPIKAGYNVKVNGSDSAVVGYDGEVFIQNLAPENILEVDRLDQGKCHVRVPYALKTSSTEKLGAFVCQ